MERRLKGVDRSDSSDGFDLDDLRHPAQAFEHPSNVVDDPGLTLNEKRAILASWASDACAIEAAPTLGCAPGGMRPVRFDDVMEALRTLDKQAQQQGDRSARYRRMRRERARYRSDPRDGGHGQGHALN